MGKKTPRPDVHIQSRQDRLVEMVLSAVPVGLSGTEVERAAALRAIRSLESEKNHEKKRVLWKKKAAILALDELKLFFENSGTSLSEIVEVLEGKKILDASVIKKIQQTADAWANLGRIGD